MTQRTVGIIGATGYVGSEAARWVLAHPQLTLAVACSRQHAGQPLASAVPGLLGHTDVVLSDVDPVALSACDVVLICTPHGAAGQIAPTLRAAVVVDLSADHRHAAGWVYGQPEWCAEALSGAPRIAAPGCFATAISLALAPLVSAGVVRGAAHVVAATGSTGSGAAPGKGTHHPERFANLKAYKVLSHQHVPEVRTFLAGLGDAPPVHFVPLSAPIDRGILATCLVEVGDVDAAAIVADAYAAHPLVRLRSGSPEVRLVRGSAYADLAVTQQDGVAAVVCAIDNLGRGAASQAVQALNLALGWPVTTGLFVPAVTP